MTRGGSSEAASAPDAVRRVRKPYGKPGRALAVAALGFVLSAAAALWPPSLSGFPPAALAAALVVLTMAPLACAVLVAGIGSPGGVVRSAGFVRWSWTDIAAGGFAGVGARGVVELIAPTAASTPGVVGSAQAVIVTLVAAVVIAPIVEETFFRGLVLGAGTDALASAIGRTASALVAIAVSTVAFVALHAIARGADPDLLLATTLMGVVSGILAVATGQIFAPVAAHVVFNGVGVALVLG